MMASRSAGVSGFLRKAFAWIRKDFLEETSYRFAFFFSLWGILFAVVVFFFLSRVMPEATNEMLARYGGGYFPFVLVGFSLAHYVDLALNGMSRRIRETQILGTLEALLATRTPAWQILLLSILYPLLSMALIGLLYLFVAWLFFGLDLSKAVWGSAFLYLILTISSLLPLGIVSASITLVFKRGDPVAFALTGLTYLLSGVFYPVAVMPAWLQTLAQFFPLTHALEGMRRALSVGVGVLQEPKPFLFLVAFTVVLLPLSIVLFSRALTYARRSGGLHHY